MNKIESSENLESHAKRPSPFGPAASLLPQEQKIIFISQNENVANAVGMLIDSRFSQLPVKNSEDKVVGIFSYRSLAKKNYSLRGRPIDFRTLLVGACLEPAKYISPEEYIDTSSAADFRQDDYVLVGSPEKVIGILAIADVFERLNEFAEAFVLLHEIEIAIRELIEKALGEDGLTSALARINERNRNSGHTKRQLESIKDCNFSDYLSLIAGKDWESFESYFEFSKKDLINEELKNINTIRNDVFHFRRKVSHSDVSCLRDFRNQLKTSLAL